MGNQESALSRIRMHLPQNRDRSLLHKCKESQVEPEMNGVQPNAIDGKMWRLNLRLMEALFADPVFSVHIPYNVNVVLAT
jgi:hypothetical protein